MIRSRHLALSAVVVAFGLASCGDPSATSTTAPVAEKPKVIELASGQRTSGGAATPAAASADASTESKIAYMGTTEFVYDGELPALDGPAGSWFFAPGQQADVDRIAKLAASLGVVGEVRTLPDEQGGGWAVGPEDYSGAVLMVGSDGMLNWYLSPGPTVGIGYACADSGVAVSSTGAVGAGGTTEAAPPADTIGAGTAPGGVVAPDVLPTDVPAPDDGVMPDCQPPEPPAGVPTKDEALAKAKELFDAWGYDADSFQFDEPYADEWGASVNASLVLNGMKAPVMLSVGFGENGTTTYASGYLADPQPGADYPTIGAAAGLERLKTEQNQYITLDRGGVAMGAPTDVGVATGEATRPAIAPCEPEAASNDCAPVNSDPITVTLNSVKADLTMVWAADNTIWLLPAYTFGTADGGQYSVIAVEDAYLHQADPPVDTKVPVIEPGIVPVPATAVAVRAPTQPAPEPTTTLVP